MLSYGVDKFFMKIWVSSVWVFAWGVSLVLVRGRRAS